MKKRDLKKLALTGIASGLLSSTLAAQETTLFYAHASHSKKNIAMNDDKKSSSQNDDPNSQNMGYHLYTEEELLMELNAEGTTLYNSLSTEGKALARQVASQRCQASNPCAGLNACETESNKCAGQGKCKGQGKCAFSDKNLAVKVVAQKMAKKRATISQ